MTPILPRTVTLLCGVFAVVGVMFAALTDGLIISPVRTAVALFAILMGTVFLASVAPLLNGNTAAPPPVAVVEQTPVAPAAGSMHRLLESLYPDEPEPAVPAPLRLVDADTGELVGDRVLRLEERMSEITREVVDLGGVVEAQAQLTAKAFGTLRREVERIGHLFPETSDA